MGMEIKNKEGGLFRKGTIIPSLMTLVMATVVFSFVASKKLFLMFTRTASADTPIMPPK